MIKRKIFFWYIFKELLSPFALGLLIFTFVLLMNRILKLMDMVINKGIGIGEVINLILFLLPSLLVLTVPMSILLAILIALGKLSADSEIIAMKSSGISLYQMLPPFAALCILGFLATNLLTLFLLPRGNYAFKDHIIKLAKKHSEASLEEGVFNDAFEGMVIYINRFNREEKQINGILVSDRRDPEFQNVIVAKDAMILSGQGNSGVLFRLFNGSLHRLSRRSMSYQYAVFDTYEMNVKLGEASEERKLKYRELSLRDLLKLSGKRKKIKKSTTRINVEIHQRFAFPFACFVLALLGVPLGVYWRRGGRSYGFVLSIVIVFLYYLLLNIGESLAKSGYLFAFMGIWMPNAILGALGIYLFRKVAREEPIPLQQIGITYLESAINRINVWDKKRKGPHAG